MTDRSPSSSASSTRLAFWTCAAVLALALWTSGAPTTVYPLYASDWHLAPVWTTAIFAVYPLALVVVLLVFGDLSDYIGRRGSILLGVLASMIGVLLFAVAPGIAWVLVGRALMGIGVGLSLSPATARMIDLAGPAASARTSSIATASTATGLALATLIGGALVQYGPAPLHLTFWVLLVVEVVVFVGVWRLPADRDTAAGRWRPRGIRIPRSLLGVVAAAALCVSASYTLGAIVLSLGADIGADLVGSSNAFVTGLIITVSAVVIGVVAILTRNVSPAIAAPVGAVVTAAALGLLVLAGIEHSLVLFLGFTALGGAGYSLFFSAGLALVGRFAPAHHRAGTLSAVYLVAYLFQGAIALWLGSVATAGGLERAVDVGAPVVVAIGVVALVLVLTLARPRKAPAVATL